MDNRRRLRLNTQVLAFVTAHTMGDVIHILLVIAIVAVLMRAIMDRRAL